MRFPVDPSLVRIDAFTGFVLAFLLVILPTGAVRQHRRHWSGGALPTRPRIYASAIATHLSFLVLVAVVAWKQDVDMLPPYRPTAVHVLVGVAALALGLLPLFGPFRRSDQIAKARTRLIAPRTPKEFGFFYLVALSAGIAEELTYRGLLFTLVAVLTGGWWSAAIIASIAFGIVHLFQGWKSAGLAALMGLREHIVVGLTGTLFIAMVVHALHDAVAGTVIGIRARREETTSAASPSTA